MWIQRHLRLAPQPRGFHLITREVGEALPELAELRVGMLHLLIQHTSASLALNENASPDVRRDFAVWFDQAVPDGAPYWSHTLEGDDDMPAHVKSALLGSTLMLPVMGGRLALGTWQGVYLCEHRDHGGSRVIIATAWGETG
jgi:secondary thiamine-phosphate synthase enzyme